MSTCYLIPLPAFSFFFVCGSSNFGVKLVSSKERLVTAAEVIKAGPYAPQKMETIIITLMHLALHSEKMELEVCTFPLKLINRPLLS